MGETGKKDANFDAVQAAQELDDALTEAALSEPPTSEEYIEALETEIEGLSAVVAQKEEQLRRAQVQVAGHLEETERIKKRLTHEAEQRIKREVTAVINEMLDVGDDLARAITSAHSMDHNPAVVEGIELVRQSFGRKLQNLGVTHMPSMGEAFDPALHDAVSMLPITDPAQDGVILAVVKEGFRINGEILREARVAVGKLGQ